MADEAAQLGLRVAALLPGMVARAPDPEAARAGLERLLQAAPAAVWTGLGRDPSLVEAVLAILGNSEFLTEALVQSPELVLWLDAARNDGRGRAREEWSAALATFTAEVSVSERASALTRFKRREYLRIVLRDLQGVASLAETTQELSHLADAVLERAYAWAWNDLAERFGTPLDGAGAGAEMAVLGLGKLGGEELNYNSDIDLMFLYSADGETAGGAQSTSNHEFFSRLAQAVIQYASAVTTQGRAYRVDLRLRPGGREGELALALPPALSYYRQQARDWELQMLIRARPCAGSRALAQQFLAVAGERIYPRDPDPPALAQGVRLSRQRISAQLERHRAVGRRAAAIDVKLDAGGIRDIEFLVQYLQRLHGGTEAWVRSGNTLVAMQRLHDKRWLGGAEFQLLSSAYWLLRHIEHRLQLRLGQQTHTLPSQPDRLWSLARSLRLAEGGRLSAAAGDWFGAWAAPAEAGPAGRAALAQGLRHELARRMAEVRRLYQDYLGAEGGEDQTAARLGPGEERAWPARLETELDLGRHGRRQWQRLLRSAATQPEAEAVIRDLPQAALPRLAWALEASDWMAEAVIRRPQLATVFVPGVRPPVARPPMIATDFADGMGRLRVWRQQRMLESLLAEWEDGVAIASTLASCSTLAVETLGAALELARRSAPPLESFAVLALGRLGLGELDLLSDVDLVFVAVEAEREDGARLAAKFIEVLTAYTQQGSLYAVDTRLRPGGGEGELVQTPGSLATYFERRAGVWEAISYLKARVVAGDRGLGAAALEAAHGQTALRFSGAEEVAAKLAGLRDRMEREGRPGRWGLKTSPGGYYDVDFVVSSRMLRAGLAGPVAAGLAGLVRALPPALLDPEVAAELAGLTELLRAADHALRVATGKAGAAIPASGEGIDRAAAWLGRIWPQAAGLAVQPAAAALAAAVDGARARIRQIYRMSL